MRPVYLFEDIEMRVVSYDVFGVSSNCTIYELIVIDISSN